MQGSASQRRAFVTGGSGFIGRHLLGRLHQEGWNVKALARSDQAAAMVESLGAKPIRGSLADVDALVEGTSGCSACFHLAAITEAWGDQGQFEDTNVAGTERVVQACLASGVRRLVHAGAMASVATGKPLVNVDESLPLQTRSRSMYGRTKALSEELVQQANSADLETVILRLRLVWGPGDTTILRQFVKAMRRNRYAWVNGGRHLISTTHIDNAVEALCLVGADGRPGHTYLVSDGKPVQFKDFITRLVAVEGVTPPERSGPRWLGAALAASSEQIWRTFQLAGNPPLSRTAFMLVSNEVTLDTSKARRELGYRPVKTVDDGLAEMAEASAAETPPVGVA